jgi:hypothetical protein
LSQRDRRYWIVLLEASLTLAKRAIGAAHGPKLYDENG